MTKSEIFKLAHTWTKKAFEDNRAEGFYLAHFSKFLKRAYQIAKQAVPEDAVAFGSSSTKFKGVKIWFAAKEYGMGRKAQREAQGKLAVKMMNDVEVQKETEKAVLLTFNTAYGESKKWFPKSVLVA